MQFYAPFALVGAVAFAADFFSCGQR